MKGRLLCLIFFCCVLVAHTLSESSSFTSSSSSAAVEDAAPLQTASTTRTTAAPSDAPPPPPLPPPPRPLPQQQQQQQHRYSNKPSGSSAFDGFDFGFGGQIPVDSGIDGFTSLVYDAIFRNVLNSGASYYLAAGLPNDVNVSRLLPAAARAAAERDVVTGAGLAPAELYLEQFYARASAREGAFVPAGCVVRLSK
jgi:hypothetical protein